MFVGWGSSYFFFVLEVCFWVIRKVLFFLGWRSLVLGFIVWWVSSRLVLAFISFLVGVL